LDVCILIVIGWKNPLRKTLTAYIAVYANIENCCQTNRPITKLHSVEST